MAAPFFTSAAHAADPYDQNLEKRVEALERELNIMEDDSKGKNVQADNSAVPTFLRAAGSNVQQLTISGDLRFRYNYDNEDFQVPGGGNELQRSRYLFRLRLNLNYTLSDNFFVALSVCPRSARRIPRTSRSRKVSTTTASTCTSSSWAGRRPTGRPSSWARRSRPSTTTRMPSWTYGDINPTGVTEKFNFDINPNLNISANFGQYIFYDNPESGYSGHSGHRGHEHGRQGGHGRGKRVHT